MPPFPNEEIEVKINYLILGYETTTTKKVSGTSFQWHGSEGSSRISQDGVFQLAIYSFFGSTRSSLLRSLSLVGRAGPTLSLLCAGFSCCGAQAPGHLDFSSWGTQGLSCPSACGILVLRSGIKPIFSAVAGGLLTTAPPGKSLVTYYWCKVPDLVMMHVNL